MFNACFFECQKIIHEFNTTCDLNVHNLNILDAQIATRSMYFNSRMRFPNIYNFLNSFLGGRLAKISAITNLDYEIELDKLEDPTVLETLKMCLQKDPEKRASIEELLTHAFLRLTKDSKIIETKTLEGFEREF